MARLRRRQLRAHDLDDGGVGSGIEISIHAGGQPFIEQSGQRQRVVLFGLGPGLKQFGEECPLTAVRRRLQREFAFDDPAQVRRDPNLVLEHSGGRGQDLALE